MRSHLMMAVCALAAALPLTAQAGGENLANCTWPNGDAIRPDVCDYLRRAATAEGKKWQSERLNPLGAEPVRWIEQAHWSVSPVAIDERIVTLDGALQRREAMRVATEEKVAKDAENTRQWLADEAARDTQRKASQAKADATYRIAEQRAAARRAECGADLDRPRIGMTLQRANLCLGTLYILGEVNRADGIVQTLRGGRWQLTAMGDKVVAWR